MKRTASVAACLLAFGIVSSAQTVNRIDVTEPLRYEQRAGRLVVRSSIVLSGSLPSSGNFRLDGTALPVERTSRQDSVIAWMPMVGGSHTLELRAGGRTLSSFRAESPIDGDWGHFQNGEILIIQSSHQDIGWMDTPDYCRRERIEDIIIPALDIMKTDTAFTFEMEQTLNLMELLEDHPERKEEVIRRYREGRFFWGATFNQPYEGYSSGEQLVRQAYFGRKWIKENLPGCDDFTATNMDVPGRALQIPQILAKSGIKYLYISRHGEGHYDWYSPDGTSIPVYTQGHYGWEASVWNFFSEGTVSAFRKVHARVGLWNDYYLAHNMPPVYSVLISCDASKPQSFSGIIAQWNDIASKSEVPLPRLKYSNAETFMSVMDGPGVRRDSIYGERPNLWLYIHGPAHYEQSVDKRRSSVVLPAAEFFGAYNWLRGYDYPRAALDRAWLATLYQDHGIGGKNGEITDRIFGDSLAVGRRIGERKVAEAVERIASDVKGSKGDLVLFNDLPSDRESYVDVPCTGAHPQIRDASGAVVPCQANGSSVRFKASVPSMGYARYTLRAKGGKTPASTSLRGANFHSNRFYDIRLGDGGIVSLYDKELGRDVMEGEKYAFGDIMQVGYDGHGAGEFIKIRPTLRDTEVMLSDYPANWRVVESGPLFTTYCNEVRTAHATVIQSITVYDGIKKIDFDVTLRDFDGEHNLQYRIMFPLKMKLKAADIDYAVPMAVSRVGRDELREPPMGWGWEGSYENHPADSHPREVLDFISASGNGFGFTMASGVSVCDWIDPRREVADYPVVQGILLSSHRSCHGEGNWYHQTGTHQYHFAVTTHAEGWRNGYGFALGESHPLYVCAKTSDGGAMEPVAGLMRVSDPLVAVSTVKKADNEDCMVLRLCEMEGVDKDVTVTLPFDAVSVRRCNLVEEDIEPATAVNGNSITVHLGHNAVETFKVRFAPVPRQGF
ncbi:MAG: glycosyl hydrolase-related protein [Bacteroidales bacterium]|nr:glycosyl hydrolase-related protein [Bacteroidales bacterium]